jgi:hypothetical protein
LTQKAVKDEKFGSFKEMVQHYGLTKGKYNEEDMQDAVNSLGQMTRLLLITIATYRRNNPHCNNLFSMHP